MKIEVAPNSDGESFRALVAGSPGVWGHGRSAAEAIGNLLLAFAVVRGLTIDLRACGGDRLPDLYLEVDRG